MYPMSPICEFFLSLKSHTSVLSMCALAINILFWEYICKYFSDVTAQTENYLV